MNDITEREINLSDAALRERAMEYERCDEWHYKHNPVEREKVKRLLASYIALRDAARAEQRVLEIPWDIADPFKRYGCRCEHHTSGDEDCASCCQGKRFDTRPPLTEADVEAVLRAVPLILARVLFPAD